MIATAVIPAASMSRPRQSSTTPMTTASAAPIRFSMMTVIAFSRMRSFSAVAETTDLKDFDAAAWIGYAAPAGTPREVLQKLSSEMHRILASPETKDKLTMLGLDPAPSSPDEMRGFLAREQERYAAIIKMANVKVE